MLRKRVFLQTKLNSSRPLRLKHWGQLAVAFSRMNRPVGRFFFMEADPPVVGWRGTLRHASPAVTPGAVPVSVGGTQLGIPVTQDA